MTIFSAWADKIEAYSLTRERRFGKTCNSEENSKVRKRRKVRKRNLSQADWSTQKIHYPTKFSLRRSPAHSLFSLLSFIRGICTPISEVQLCTLIPQYYSFTFCIRKDIKMKMSLPPSGKEADVVGMVMSSFYKLEARNISHPVSNSCIDYTAGMRYDGQRQKFALKNE